ncbi:MAG: VanW family protein [Patescibacteria group bacterium]|nr:VanW family protein [Patescibacteria group bacterium]
MAKKKPQSKASGHWLAPVLTIFFIIILVLGAGAGYLLYRYRARVIPNVELAGRTVERLSREEISDLVETYAQQIETDGLIFAYQDKTVSINPTILSATDPDLTYKILSFEPAKTAEAVFQYGHRKNYFRSLADFILAFVRGIKVAPSYSLDRVELNKILRDNFSELESPAKNPKIVLSENGNITVSPERDGEILDYASGIEELTNLISTLEAKVIELNKIPDLPSVTVGETNTAQTQLKQILTNRLPWILVSGESRWAVGQAEITNWFTFSRNSDDQVKLDFDEPEIIKYLQATPGQTLNLEPKEGKFKMENNRVTEFQMSQKGAKINYARTLEQMRLDLLDATGSETRIIVDPLEPTSFTRDVNELGIIELVAVGKTNFKGSPKNRVYNITVGANKLNGLLIKPGEEFSLVKAIGEVDASTGFLPELVIKGNRTIPEYGGGLCQIGTTAFRVVLNAGLPILERQNHSYRVSYYEPPVGMDATIYSPKPDFRFVNDFNKTLLLQTRIEKTELIFEFYGTKDGREITLSDPKVTNYVKPGPTKYVETEDLAPGQTKCTEKAHTGADAEFTYTVKYPDDQTKSVVFESHYKAWPEVCLVGKQPVVEAPAETPPVEENTTP